MIPFSELSRFKAPIGRPSAGKQDNAVFFGKKCAISRFVLMLDKLINLEKGNSKFNSYWEHLADFSPELFVAIDRFVPFRANQSASQGRLQIYAAQDDLSSFVTLRKEIPPVLSAWTFLAWNLAKGLALHSGFHFWRVWDCKCFFKDWKLTPRLFCSLPIWFFREVFLSWLGLSERFCLDNLERDKKRHHQNHPSNWIVE